MLGSNNYCKFTGGKQGLKMVSHKMRITTTNLFAFYLCATLSYLALLQRNAVLAAANSEKQVAAAESPPPSYKVPNPFQVPLADKQGEYYLIRSTQSVFSSHKQNEKLEVLDYFSLSDAISYSVHSKLEDKQRSWALLGDGKYGRWYVLRNPDANDERDLECELDQVHSHRQVFPWQYVYDLSSAGDSSSTIVDPFPGLLPEPTNKRRKKKNEKKSGPRKSFIYGVGAIWLNAIKGDVRSTLVGARSPYDLSNSWVLESNRLRVELLFDKIKGQREPGTKPPSDAIELERQLNAQPLGSVKLDRKHLVESNGAAGAAGLAGATATVDEHGEYIVVSEFKSGLNKENSAELLARIETQLEYCRRTNKQHRIFPSLLRALASSPQRIYELVYTAKYMPAFREGDGAQHNGAYNEKRHRYLHSFETVREFLSLSERTEMLVYEPLVEKEPGRGIDAFISKFADKPPGQRTTRQSNSYYHLFIEGESENCAIGVREPLSRNHLLQRPFYFHSAGQEHLAHIRGLGALLMNVADWPYKSFNVMGRKIKVAQNPLEVDDIREVETDEWQVEDKHSGWRISLFIERRNRALEPVSWDLTERARADLKRLVRVDVRDMRAVDLAEDVIKSAEENKNDDYDLLFQYTLVEVNFRLHQDELELFTNVPEICQEVIDSQIEADKKRQEEEQEKEEEQEAEQSDREQAEDLSYDKDYHNDDDDDASSSGSSPEGQNEGEQFEFEPGQLHEDFPLPDFLDFLEDATTYKFTTKLELFDGEDDPNDIGEEEEEEEGDEVKPADQQQVGPEGGRKHIWLQEVVDLKTERASLSVFNTDEALKQNKPDERYLVFYESELLFRLTSDRCEHVKEPSNKWLRLFSSQWIYHILPNYSNRKSMLPDSGEEEEEEPMRVATSSQLSLFGVGALWRHASEASLGEYLGKRRAIIERDGKQYRQLVWLVQEFDMAVRFNFLMEHQSHDQKEFRHLVANTPEQILRLESIVLSNQLADGFVADHFKQVRASIGTFEIGKDKMGDVLRLPSACRDSWIEAQRMSEVEVAPPATPLSMYDLLGGPEINGYELNYVITHTTSSVNAANPEGGEKSAVMKVNERFNRARNRAQITVTFMGMPVDIYIEGESKRMYAHSRQLSQCSVIDSLAPVFKALMGDLLLENKQFEPTKMYGLAGLINDLASHTAKLETDSYLDNGGRKEERRTYKLQLDAPTETPVSGGGGGEPAKPLDVSMVYRKERPRLAADFDDVAKARIRAGDKFVLRTINLRPRQARVTRNNLKKSGIGKLEKSTLIYMSRADTFSGNDWTLPQACQDAGSATGSGSQSQSQSGSGGENPTSEAPETAANIAAFPKIDSLLARLDSFHMRSEVSLEGELNKVYLLDEWLHNGHLRMRSRGLGKARENNFDFIVYLDTQEQFDLSTPLKCQANHFPPDVLGTRPATTVLDVLRNEAARVNRLASLYYGPLMLWKLADRYLETAKLSKSVEISMAHLDSAESFMKQIGRELNKEVWQIRPPASSPHKWSYSLEFHKYQRQDEQSYLEWHVLNSIQVEDLEGTRIFVDIVNYNYRPEANDVLELFRLPEGWGCRREASYFDSYHEFSLDWRTSWYLSYEASLELLDPPRPTQFDDPELGSLSVDLGRRRAPLPTLSGSYLRSYVSETQQDNNKTNKQPETARADRATLANADLSIHVSHTRFVNGSSQLKRLVTDRRRPIEFEVDEQSGGCSVSRAFTGSWQLVFPEDDDDDGRQGTTNSGHKIYLLGVNADQLGFLFQQLFLYTVGGESLNYLPLNKYSDDLGRTVHSSYEREFNSLRLTTELEGPARVVRRFDHVRGQSGQASIALNMRTILDPASGLSHVVVPYNSISVRVFLLTPDKTRVRAILDAKVRQHQVPRLGELLASASVTECFNRADPVWDRQVAHYTLEYPMREYAMRLMASYYFTVIRDNLYANLLRWARLMPLQLDGGARVDLSQRDNLLRVHFSVMEAPTSYLYFNEHVQCAMTERVEAASELRLVSSLHECSRWCDHINCLAMSYCDDHTCRVATGPALLGRQRAGAPDLSPPGQSIKRLDLADCLMQSSCTYYYSKRLYRTRSLKTFKDFMERVVNSQYRANDMLKEFGLSFGIYNQITPTRFYESSDMFRWQHEEDPNEFAPATGPNRGAHSESYAKLAGGKMLDLSKLDMEQFHGFGSITSHATSTSDCLSSCDHGNCLLVSHCKQSLECRALMAPDFLAVADKLGELKREIFVEAAKDCAIFTRDYLDQFERFDKTLVPSGSSRQLEAYTALECARACVDTADDACLSFDLCTFNDDNDQPGGAAGQSGDKDDENGYYFQDEAAGADSGAGGAEVGGTCFLQASHVTLDSFDRAVLLPAWDAEGAGANRNKIANRSVVCQHHSRSVLLIFQRIANKKIPLERSHRKATAIKGISAERCAADCLRDDQCHAFEHCIAEQSWPRQSCYIVRSDDFVVAAEEGASNETQPIKLDVSLESLSKLAKNSRYCSIYVAKSLAARDQSGNMLAQTGELPGTERGSSSHGALLVIVLMLVAILLGASIQFVYIRLTGRPLLVR